MDGRFQRADIDIQHTETAYRGFFRVLRHRLTHRLFNGGWSQPLTREVFVRGESVGILLYDPQRDCVALAQQFRIGCLGNAQGAWVWEVVAGMLEPGESPRDVAVREVAEETGLTIDASQLSSVCSYYSSPGGTDEYLHLFCAECALPASVEGVYGLPAEGEDIRIACFPCAEAFRAVQEGRINNAATVIALQWLQLRQRATPAAS